MLYLTIVPLVAVAGLAIGIGAAVYANREEIKAFIEKKQLQWRLEQEARRRRRRFDAQQQQQQQQQPDTRDADVFSLYEMNPGEARDEDEDLTDRESIDTADFLSQGVTNYYSTGHTSSANTDSGASYSEPRYLRASTSTAHYTRDGEFLVRRRATGGAAVASYTNAHAPPPSYGAPAAGGEAFSMQNLNHDPFASDTPFETDVSSLNFPSRSNSIVSDASWIMSSSATEDTLSELNTPTASEHEFTDDERQRIIIGQPFNAAYPYTTGQQQYTG